MPWLIDECLLPFLAILGHTVQKNFVTEANILTLTATHSWSNINETMMLCDTHA